MILYKESHRDVCYIPPDLFKVYSNAMEVAVEAAKGGGGDSVGIDVCG